MTNINTYRNNNSFFYNFKKWLDWEYGQNFNLDYSLFIFLIAFKNCINFWKRDNASHCLSFCFLLLHFFLSFLIFSINFNELNYEKLILGSKLNFDLAFLSSIFWHFFINLKVIYFKYIFGLSSSYLQPKY